MHWNLESENGASFISLHFAAQGSKLDGPPRRRGLPPSSPSLLRRSICCCSAAAWVLRAGPSELQRGAARRLCIDLSGAGDAGFADVEAAFYYRWREYRKHLNNTPDGWVVTEFLPNVPWAGKDNTIPAAAGHHIAEGRWIHNATYLDDYITFWFERGGKPRSYTSWFAWAVQGHRHKFGPCRISRSSHALHPRPAPCAACSTFELGGHPCGMLIGACDPTL